MTWLKPVDPLTQRIVTENKVPRFSTVLYGSFAGLALLLAAVGIYGVMAFAVAQRTHEIGLRPALEAGRSQVMRMVLNEGALLALAGLGVGSIGAYLVGRV